MKAYHALSRFRRGAPFRPWLLRIVANEARNRRRAAGRAARLALRAAQDQPSGDAVPSPEATRGSGWGADAVRGPDRRYRCSRGRPDRRHPSAPSMYTATGPTPARSKSEATIMLRWPERQ